VPPDETAAAICQHCGPIWLHPAVGSVAPVVDGWPRVLGCPWCHVKNRDALPRPLLTPPTKKAPPTCGHPRTGGEGSAHRGAPPRTTSPASA
jgi:hypothetical protein